MTSQQQSDDSVIRVSTKNSPFFYINLIKKKLASTNSELEVSGIGAAINSVVMISEILKSQGFCQVKKLSTSLTNDDTLPRLQIWLTKTPQFDSLYQQEQQTYH